MGAITMTTRKRLRIAVWIVLIAIGGLAGVSYLHPFHTRISRSDGSLIGVSIRDGIIKIFHLSAESNATHIQASRLQNLADRLTGVSPRGLPWYRNVQLSSNLLRPLGINRTGVKETPIRYVGVGGSVIPPLLAFFLIVWAVKRRRQLVGAIREIIRPSDRHTVRPFRRVIHRSLVVILGLATLLSVGMWVISHMDLFPDYSRVIDQDSLLLIDVSRGRVEVVYASPIAKGTIIPNHDFALAGFRWNQRTFQSEHRIVEVVFPCWVPIMLFSIWPVIAFVRRPYRRAARRAEGCCLNCGYNLTGLVEPRCAECGTATCPDRVLRPPCVIPS